MTVYFEVAVVDAGQLRKIKEEEVLQDRGASDRLDDPWDLEGVVVIEVDGARFEASDTLFAAIQNLSFDGVASLLSQPDRPYLYRYSSADHHVVMITLADHVRVFGESGPSVTEAAAVLLPNLYECGMRFLRLLDSLGAQGADLATHLRPHADRARTQLEQHRLI